MALRMPAFVETQLDSMSPRDRRLLVGLALAMIAGFVILVWYVLSGQIDDRASRVMGAKRNLQVAHELDADGRAALLRIQAAEKRLAMYTGQPFAAYVEKVAANNGLSEALRAVTEVNAEMVGSIRQTRYRVEVRGVQYSSANSFIFELETNGYPLMVQSAKYKPTRQKDGVVIDLTVEVIVSKLAEG